jgi:hypothetical protein
MRGYKRGTIHDGPVVYCVLVTSPASAGLPFERDNNEQWIVL